ncbi:MAG: LysE family translocator [Deltaproteobacteria bacterium]|nr:LysE family translocator [Deltaproteobacteria bacterium]
MIDTSNFTLFIITSIAVILMPGPAMLFVISNGLTRGPKASIAAAFGTTAGVSFHLFCAAFGLAVILKTSAIAFAVVKFAGAAYLIYLAIKTLLSKEQILNHLRENEKSGNSIFWQGIFINILNPKLSIFFLAFLPQFIDPKLASATSQTLILGTIFMAMTIIIFICYGIFASLLRQKVLNNPKILKAIKWCFASVFMALGVRLALSEK